MSSRWTLGISLIVAVVAVSCTGAYLFDERRDENVPLDRAVALEGRLCTVGANEVARPIKILISMDASQSMRVTDPDGTRARAVVQLIENLPNDPEVYIGVMLFAGSTTAYLTGAGMTDGGGMASPFVQVSSLTPYDRLRLVEQILTFTAPQTNRDSTDFVKALADIYAVINRDISLSNQDPRGALARARYSIIFLSDGHPTNNQDDELLQGDAVVRIRQLKDLADDVRFNTVHVFNPTQPVSSVCDLSGDAGTGCPLLIINQDAERLQKMAELGGGDFRDFRNNEPINFLNFRFGQVRRAYNLREMVATNLSALAGSLPGEADSDGDKLSDEEEATLLTDPLRKDTDGDGFSDGVEVIYGRLGAPFNPIQRGLPDGGGLDPGCPPPLRGVDSDCDALLDCDEQLIGTNATLIDSDRDGVPDSIEWQLGTQGASNDLEQDPDTDGLTNRTELRLHTNPQQLDSTQLTVNGYRYFVEVDGPVDERGRQCYRFRVENISLANTLPLYWDGGTDAGYDAGQLVRGPGFNDLMLAVAMVPADDPKGRTLMRLWRSNEARYPVGGIKSPVDGVLYVAPEDLVAGCRTAPDGGVGADGG